MTLMLIAVTTLLGTLISILAAAGRRSGMRCCGDAITGYVELIRNTPFLVQLFFIFFGLPSLGIRLDPIVAAILAMTLNMAAYTTEIVGAGLDAVPNGPARGGAARWACDPAQVFVKIVLPQALKVIFPALTSQIVIMMLESAVVSQIAVRELTYRGRHAAGPHLPRLRDLSRRDAGLSRPVDRRAAPADLRSAAARLSVERA